MPALLTDLRFAYRALTKSPWFTLLAVLTLAIGIGGTTVLFSLVNAVLLNPLPFKEPHRLVEIWGRTDQRTGMRVPGAMLEALRARSKTLAAIGTHDPSGGVLNSGGAAIDIRGETVSANFTEVFGVPPLAGRGFVPDDERAGAPAVMLVSFAFWQQYLGADRHAVGRTVLIDGVPYTVVGIMPPDFRTTFGSFPPVFWTPYAGSRSRERERELGYEIVARLAAGVTIDQSRSELEAIAAAVQVEGWQAAGRRLGLVSLRDEVVGDRAYALELMMYAAVLVLAVACANLAQLLLVRSDRRTAEFATRKAIGASVPQLFRLALCESLLLSALGGAAGVAAAHWLVPVVVALAPLEIPRLIDASIDTRVLVMAVATSVLTGCLFGFAPALRLSRLSVTQAMKPATVVTSKHRARFRSALVVVQVAVAVMLLAVGSLVVRTFFTLLPASPGFATASRSAFVWSFIGRQFPDAADRRQRVGDWMERLGAVPGVTAVAVGSGIPFGDDEPRNVPLRQADDVRPVSQTTTRTDFRAVSPNFFQLLDIPVLTGRSFTAGDGSNAPRIGLVNKTLADRLAPSGSVVGQSIRLGSTPTSPVYEIVGVVGNTRWWGTSLAPLNEVYIPLAQDSAQFGFVIVQSGLDTVALTNAIRTTFAAAAPGAALPADRRATPLDELIRRSVAGPRFSATLMASSSITVWVLAVIGLFGLVAYSVSYRHREFGIRTALGAKPADLIVASIRSASLLTVAGVACGLGAAFYLTRVIQSQLYGVTQVDWTTFAFAAMVMIVTGGVAAYVPARRAVRVDPMVGLREG
jgi:putative ABC transport system permease protein